MQIALNNVGRVTVATYVLHNIAIAEGDEWEEEPFAENIEDEIPVREWETYGIRIRELLNQLTYADNIVLITDKKEELQKMIEELDRNATEVGLEMNYSKTKRKKLEQVAEYIYLGHIIKLNRDNQTEEIKEELD
ncbi:uncharacterized protein [Diabrotica undecimpunctata]|uniref:uncharacterized protein n=1 Tax=Diabrotica undecimpunctata TaxID=50387 RepID=UPI003B63E85E